MALSEAEAEQEFGWIRVTEDPLCLRKAVTALQHAEKSVALSSAIDGADGDRVEGATVVRSIMGIDSEIDDVRSLVDAKRLLVLRPASKDTANHGHSPQDAPSAGHEREVRLMLNQSSMGRSGAELLMKLMAKEPPSSAHRKPKSLFTSLADSVTTFSNQATTGAPQSLVTAELTYTHASKDGDGGDDFDDNQTDMDVTFVSTVSEKGCKDDNHNRSHSVSHINGRDVSTDEDPDPLQYGSPGDGSPGDGEAAVEGEGGGALGGGSSDAQGETAEGDGNKPMMETRDGQREADASADITSSGRERQAPHNDSGVGGADDSESEQPHTRRKSAAWISLGRRRKSVAASYSKPKFPKLRDIQFSNNNLPGDVVCRFLGTATSKAELCSWVDSIVFDNNPIGALEPAVVEYHRFKSVKTLRMRCCDFGFDSVPAALVRGVHKSLTHLDLSDNPIDESGAHTLMQALTSSSSTAANLNALNLRNCQISAFPKRLRYEALSHLKELNVSLNGLKEIPRRLVGGGQRIRTIRARGNQLGSSGLKLLLNSLTEKRTVPSTIVLLDLADNSLGHFPNDILYRKLFPALMALDISFNRLRNLHGLEDFASIEYLSTAHNPLLTGVVDRVVEGQSDVLRYLKNCNRTFKAMDSFTPSVVITDVEEALKHVLENGKGSASVEGEEEPSDGASLSDKKVANTVSDEKECVLWLVSEGNTQQIRTLVSIADALRTTSKRISALCVENDLMGDEIAKSFVKSAFVNQHVRRCLRSLHLRGNVMSSFCPLPVGGYGLFKSMEEVDISRNKLVSLPAGFGLMPSLVYVNLSSNKLQVETIQLFLEEIISSNSPLSSLDLDDNDLVHFPTVNFAALKQLRRLSLRHNSLLTLPYALTLAPALCELLCVGNLWQRRDGGRGISSVARSHDRNSRSEWADHDDDDGSEFNAVGRREVLLLLEGVARTTKLFDIKKALAQLSAPPHDGLLELWLSSTARVQSSGTLPVRICENIQFCRMALRVLDLSCSGLRDDTAQLLVDNLSQNSTVRPFLKVLDLRNNQLMQTPDFEKRAERLMSLECLGLEGNKIEKGGLKSGMKALSSLKYFGIGNNPLHDLTLPFLMSVLPVGVQSVDVHGSHVNCDEPEPLPATAHTSLETLNLSGVPVSRPPRWLGKWLPNLKRVFFSLDSPPYSLYVFASREDMLEGDDVHFFSSASNFNLKLPQRSDDEERAWIADVAKAQDIVRDHMGPEHMEFPDVEVSAFTPPASPVAGGKNDGFDLLKQLSRVPSLANGVAAGANGEADRASREASEQVPPEGAGVVVAGDSGDATRAEKECGMSAENTTTSRSLEGEPSVVEQSKGSRDRESGPLSKEEAALAPEPIMGLDWAESVLRRRDEEERVGACIEELLEASKVAIHDGWSAERGKYLAM